MRISAVGASFAADDGVVDADDGGHGGLVAAHDGHGALIDADSSARLAQ